MCDPFIAQSKLPQFASIFGVLYSLMPVPILAFRDCDFLSLDMCSTIAHPKLHHQFTLILVVYRIL